MNLYCNLSPEQRGVQRLVDEFNADEDLWRTLVLKRCLCRVSHRRLSPKRHKLLDLIDLFKITPAPPRDRIFERHKKTDRTADRAAPIETVVQTVRREKVQIATGIERTTTTIMQYESLTTRSACRDQDLTPRLAPTHMGSL